MRRFPALGLALLALCASPLHAQGTLRDGLAALFTFGNCGEPLCLDVDPGLHGSHFIPANEAGNQAVLAFIDGAIGRSVANLPLSATSSGVTFTFEGGVPVATSLSAGPIFAERAQTLGRGRVYVGLNVTGLRFQEIRGVTLDNLILNFAHVDVTGDGLGEPELENDIIQVRLGVDMSVLAASFLLTWGILDFVDIGVAVPLVHTSLAGGSVAQIFPFASTPAHRFAGTNEDPILQAASGATGSATGIGDVAARLKINAAQTTHVGVAIMGDVRFPTGDEENFLGAGDLSWRALGIISGRWGAFSPHLNAGYLARTGDLDNDAILTTLGFDHLIGTWATLAMELIGEWQVGESKLSLPGPIRYASPFERTIPSSNISESRDDLIGASVGFKARLRGGFTLLANTLVPLGTGGVQPGVVWTGGLEYTF
jgi:hypothetical protein